MTHNHDHDEHGHSHGHGGDVESSGKDAPTPGDAEKLKILINHWINHNSDHKAALEEWSLKAKNLELTDVAETLKRSSNYLARSIDELRAALNLFE